MTAPLCVRKRRIGRPNQCHIAILQRRHSTQTSDVAMKPLSTVDQSQIVDLQQQMTSNLDGWWQGRQAELADGLTTLDDAHRPANLHYTTSNAVVPLVVAAKAAEDDDDDGQARLSTRRREPVNRVPASSFAPSSICRQAPPPFGVLDPLEATPGVGVGTGSFQRAAFMPLGVCKDEPQTSVAFHAVAAGEKSEQKRERNRLAAARCRMRKVERVNQLQVCQKFCLGPGIKCWSTCESIHGVSIQCSATATVVCRHYLFNSGLGGCPPPVSIRSICIAGIS